MIIQNHDNYVNYLNDWIKSSPGGGHGLRKKIAETLGVQTSYISQVLSGLVTLKEEYALPLCHFLNLDPQETEYFIVLLAIDRAGSHHLKKYYKTKASTLRDQLRQNALRSLPTPSASTEDNLYEEYFSSWHYCAIHRMLSLGPLKLEQIRKQLRLSKIKVQKVLDYLLQVGLATQSRGLYASSPKNMHLSKNHKWVHQHHLNWRHKTVEEMQNDDSRSLHFTSVATLSEKEAEIIKSKIHQLINEVRGTIAAAKDEGVYVYSLDFFPLVPTIEEN